MFLARIDGYLTATAKHETLAGCRLLIGQRLEADGTAGGEPLVILDWLGAARHSIVLVSIDGDIPKRKLGNATPARLSVIGILDDAAGGGKR
jgi:microcompartment protein CcmK/EutM